MKLSIITPVYNEEKTIDKLIQKILKVKTETKKEIIIIDDKSNDKTREILKRYKTKKNIKIILKEKNEGKGSAVITGLKKATGDIIIIQDADLEYDPSDYPKMIKPIINKETKVVYGTRVKSKKGKLRKNKFIYTSHYIGNKILTNITNILYKTKLTDMETGYKAFTKEVLNKIMPLTAKKFEIEPEITSKILKNGFKIKETPINYFSRDFKEGKKINWKDGIKAAYYLIKYKLEE